MVRKKTDRFNQKGVMRNISSKKSNRWVALALITALLSTWCWKEEKENNKTSNWNNSSINEVSSIQWKFQLWAVEWAQIKIKTMDGRYIGYTVNTWKRGSFELDKNKIENKLKSIWVDSSYVLIEWTGWVDTDPDDDWNPDNDTDKQVNWVVKWILKLDDKKISVTPISDIFTSIVEKWLKNNKDTKKVVKEVSRSIRNKIGDIDSDDEIDRKDFTGYDMVKD